MAARRISAGSTDSVIRLDSVFGGRRCRDGQQACADFHFQLFRHLRVLLEKITGVLLALADLVTVIGIPGAGLVDQAELHAQVQYLTKAIDTSAIENLEL